MGARAVTLVAGAECVWIRNAQKKIEALKGRTKTE
jgi:hypothetical protein